MAFGGSVTRDVEWERTYQSLFERHSTILGEPDALRMAASGLTSCGCVHAVLFAEQSLAWARERYPGDVLAVAACRWWTAGEEDSTRQAPYRVVNNTLRPSGRKTAASMELVMPAVCLLCWALETLPRTPELARKSGAVYRVVPWLFPSPQSYDPFAHFQEGKVLVTYDFRSASRSLAIAANPNFSRRCWIGEELQDKGHYLLLGDLLPQVNLTELLGGVLAGTCRRKGHLEGTRYNYEVLESTRPQPSPSSGQPSSSSGQPSSCGGQEDEGGEILLTSLDSGHVVRAFHTPHFSTHFVIENARAPYLGPLSFFPTEDEVLFPPLSRFLVREVEKNFPRNPDKVTLAYLTRKGSDNPLSRTSSRLSNRTLSVAFLDPAQAQAAPPAALSESFCPSASVVSPVTF